MSRAGGPRESAERESAPARVDGATLWAACEFAPLERCELRGSRGHPRHRSEAEPDKLAPLHFHPLRDYS
jgi:hypothetical protein